MRLPALAAVALVTVAGATVIDAQAVHAQAQSTEHQSKTMVVVEKGDNLSKIANHYDTTYQRIYDANSEIDHPDLIYPDQKFRIPADEEQLKHRELPNDPAVQAAARQSEVDAAERAQTRAHTKHYVAPARTAYVKKTYAPTVASGSVWDRLAQCESGGNWHTNTGNGFYGGLQFTVSSWHAVGGSGMPNQASREEQIARAKILQARQGWGAWPACTAKLGIG